ncbi:hypothetical protein M0R45_022968 [Rubus argutus]|uniref:Uncharacterized protein n=1 Tax=Rubus argutus TaxID=59490 RepID=A0AAW1WNG1_RUBAR
MERMNRGSPPTIAPIHNLHMSTPKRLNLDTSQFPTPPFQTPCRRVGDRCRLSALLLESYTATRVRARGVLVDGLDWSGLDWIGLDWTGLKFREKWRACLGKQVNSVNRRRRPMVDWIFGLD